MPALDLKLMTKDQDLSFQRDPRLLGRAKEIGPLAFPRHLGGTPRIAAEMDAAVTYPSRNQASESGGGPNRR